MADDKPTVTLPTELITEKTFYTLSGASGGVFLVCWAINYATVDLLDYKAYRLIGLALSLIFAFVIMRQSRKKSSMKWMFSFLNGLLIFVNASGLNMMTSSYLFESAESNDKQDAYIRNNFSRQAGFISLPRLASWWPDKKLVEEYQDLRRQNAELVLENDKLNYLLTEGDDAGKTQLSKNDSLQLVINSMQTVIEERQIEIDKLTEIIKRDNADLSGKLAECIKESNQRNNDLAACRLSLQQLKGTISELKKEILDFRRQLKACEANSPTLAQLLQQVCNKQSRPDRADDKLKQQEFYKRIDWKLFCASFNAWNNRIE